MVDCQWLFFSSDGNKKQDTDRICTLLKKYVTCVYKFGLILFHSLIGGTILSVTSSSRILQRCS